MNLEQLVTHRVEVLENHPFLDHCVRLAALVVVVAVVPVHGPGVHAGIDPQERHPDAVEVPIGERPETPVGVPVLGRDSGMEDERAGRCDRKDPLVEEGAATGDHDVRGCSAEEALDFVFVRALRTEDFRGGDGLGVSRPQLGADRRLPASVVPS